MKEKELNKLDAELDEYYIAQISRLLQCQESDDRAIKIWEKRREQLRKNA